MRGRERERERERQRERERERERGRRESEREKEGEKEGERDRERARKTERERDLEADGDVCGFARGDDKRAHVPEQHLVRLFPGQGFSHHQTQSQKSISRIYSGIDVKSQFPLPFT